MGVLCHELYEKILLQLDVKDLVRYKYVCKSWHSLISDDRFIKLHLKKNNETGQHKRIVLTSSSKYFYGSGQCSLDDIHVVGSSNGLVCISMLSNEISVVNPSSREVKKLIYPANNYMETPLCFGFGYDSSTDDYKVVLGFANVKYKYTYFVMLTLKSDNWKYIGKVKYILIKNEAGTLCNGALHWFTDDKNVIISFDLCKEEFKEIPQPDAPTYEYTNDRRLGVFEGCLCIYYYSNGTTAIWVKKNDNVKHLWELILYDECKIKLDNVCPTVQKFFPPKIYLGHVSIWLCEDIVFPANVISSHGNGHIWLSTSSEDIGAPVFVNSLVSPHGTASGRLKRKKREFNKLQLE